MESPVQTLFRIQKCLEFSPEESKRFRQSMVKMEKRNHRVYGYTSSIPVNNISELAACSRNVDGLEIGEAISSDVKGTEGDIYIAKDRSRPLIVKLWKYDEDKHHEGDINDSYETITYTSLCSHLNIGPKIYDAFYCNFENTLCQVLVMEKCEKDLRFLKPDEIVVDVLHKVGKVLWDMLTFELLCVDIKPDNFVLCENGVIKMIDMSGRWCSWFFSAEFFDENAETLYVILMILFLTYRSVHQKSQNKIIFHDCVQEFIEQDSIMRDFCANLDTNFQRIKDLLAPSDDPANPSQLMTLRAAFVYYMENTWVHDQVINDTDLNKYIPKIKADLRIK
jgi:hypothetical protein